MLTSAYLTSSDTADSGSKGDGADINSSYRSTAHDWLDLVTCDTAEVIASYDHPAWNRYAAVTKNDFGKGTALYRGAFFGDSLLEEILRTYLVQTGYQLSFDDKLHFPVILKRGRNDFGKELYYYFNYSGEKQTATHIGGSGVELLAEKEVAYRQVLTLAPWDLAIVEV